MRTYTKCGSLTEVNIFFSAGKSKIHSHSKVEEHKREMFSNPDGAQMPQNTAPNLILASPTETERDFRFVGKIFLDLDPPRSSEGKRNHDDAMRLTRRPCPPPSLLPSLPRLETHPPAGTTLRHRPQRGQCRPRTEHRRRHKRRGQASRASARVGPRQRQGRGSGGAFVTRQFQTVRRVVDVVSAGPHCAVPGSASHVCLYEHVLAAHVCRKRCSGHAG